MKKIGIVLLCLALLCMAFAACDQKKNSSPAATMEAPDDQSPTVTTEAPSDQESGLPAITGIRFDSSEVVYNGMEHSIVITGNLPDNASVIYQNNVGVNAGVYEASVAITADGYAPLTLTATLTVKKASFSGIMFADCKYISSGKEKEILISHTEELPAGTTVTYQNNKATAAGTYEATATITNPNYETLVLHATMTISAPTQIAEAVVSSLLLRPDPWTFLPEAFHPENMAIDSTPISENAFASGFVSIESISDKMIGKQMNVVYTTLNQAESVVFCVDAVFDMASTVAELYQTFLNENPDSTAAFTGEYGGFRFTLSLQGAISVFEATNGTVTVTLIYDGEDDLRSGYIRLNDGIALRYESGADSLHLAYQVMVSGIKYLTELEFLRQEDVTVGYLHEYCGVDDKALKTSALIEIDGEYTRIISDKRESDDLTIDGYQEVYSTESGKLIGAEVSERVKSIQYDTLWFSLSDISQIKSVKLVAQTGKMNAHAVYLNGSESIFAAKSVGGFSANTLSRRYDIEMKDVFYIVKEVQGDKVVYQTVSAKVPMLFVQIEQLETLGEDMKEKNGSLFTTAPTVNSKVVMPVTALFEEMLETFSAVKESNTEEAIRAYILNAENKS